MPKIKLIEREVKRTQSLYELKQKTINQQGSYNLSVDLEKKLIQMNAIKELEDNHNQYNISNEYSIVLGEGIINLIGKKYLDIDNDVIFVHTEASDGTIKFQIKRADNKTYNTEWFNELYNNNIEGSIFSIYIDQDYKKLYFDNKVPDHYYDSITDLVEIYESEDYLHKGYKGETYQEVYYGVPGTGKSKGVSDIIEQFYPDYTKSGSKNVIRVTIHPEYSYFDFIGNVMPIVEKDDNGKESITYSFKPGAFTQALKTAINSTDEDKPVFLVIEEMSRGNIAAIFGDIFQLLDRKKGISEYGIYNDLISKEIFDNTTTEIKIPKNLSILGTVNTSDQNVFIMDNAFKRRFDFRYVSTKPKLGLNEFEFKIGDKVIQWNDFYQNFNKFVIEEMKLSEDKQIGQFYCNFKNDLPNEENYLKLCNKLLNYIWFDIHSNSFDGNSIIDNSIKSFESAIDNFMNHKNIFNLKFYSEL